VASGVDCINSEVDPTRISRIGLVLLLVALGSAGMARPGTAGWTEPPPVKAPQVWQVRHFSVLNTVPEGLSPQLTVALDRAQTGEYLDAYRGIYRLNPDLAQRVGTVRGVGYWLVPGDKILVLVDDRDQGIVNDFATTGEAVRHGISGPVTRTRGAYGPGFVTGLAPDHVTRVQLGKTLIAKVNPRTGIYFARGSEEELDHRWSYPVLNH
jgi:hypothetical protein